jgi:hypothetical protein
MLTGPFSPLFGPFFRAKRADPARLGPLRAGLGQKIKPAGTADPARFLAGLHWARAGPGRAARLAISRCERKRLNGPGCKCSTRVVKQDGRTGVGAARELFCLPRLLATPRFRRSHGDGGRADALPQFPSHFLLPPLSFLHRHRHRRLSLIYLESLSSYSSAACPSDHRCGSAPTSRLNPRSHPRHTRRQPQPRSTARPPWTPAPGPRPSECPTATSATPRWSSSASTAALPEGTRARPRHRPRTSRGAAPTGPSSCSPAWSPRASSSDGRCSSPSLRHTSRYYWLPTAPQFFFQIQVY